ncbi:MAG TPA: FAD-binding protein [Saprospiraceae bacterium]|nr:FAD-binding protein [Saprospiraceae bacterium]
MYSSINSQGVLEDIYQDLYRILYLCCFLKIEARILMYQQVEIKVAPEFVSDEAYQFSLIGDSLGMNPSAFSARLVKRSIDARRFPAHYLLRFDVFTDMVPDPEPALLSEFKDVSEAPEVLIIGAGPAGYFAALDLIALGLKPVIFDRGKDAQTRRRDLRAIQQFGIVNPDSNYCFGEGGAGTYSDGKLYTRSNKRGEILRPLKLLVEHGASPDILVDAHPHIGSNKLPKVIANIRETILHHGGQVHFDAKLTDIILRDGEVKAVRINDKKEYKCDTLILATGHSARDIFYLLHQKDILIEAKAFALGVRIEHPQGLIDKIQYKQSPRSEHLPASSYKLVTQVGEKGVFSFCMCPGGLIVPSATSPGELVMNGMSMSRRDSPFANSGTVVTVSEGEVKGYDDAGPLKLLEYQKMVEQSLFDKGDGSQKAPGQRLTDFFNRKISASIQENSYIPGVYSAPLHKWLPTMIYEPLRQAVKDFGRKMNGYFTEEALVVATESRTSSPVRIPRDKESLMHPQVRGLFPCGEGAGYAGGIISAAMDGEAVAKAVANYKTTR